MQMHGFEERHGETAFAFLVLRLQRAATRAELVELIRHVASVVPDAEAFISELPAELDEPIRIVGIPWVPPEAGHAALAQRRLIESAASKGVEEAWFFQTGTSLPSIDDEHDDDDDDHDDDGDTDAVVMTRQQGGDDDDDDDDPVTGAHEVVPTRAASISDAEDDDDAAWSHGPPPMVSSVRFPVDGYPAIIEELDWEDFGIAFKLAGAAIPGEGTVLLGLHSLWLSPYGRRYRNAAVTIDSTHHAVHLWVDRFAVSSSHEEQVHHLLWVVSKLDEVIPVIHARFGGATMAQKYGGLMGEAGELFVLGGNPLVAIHAEGGEAAVDAWMARQSDWSHAEIAQMLRELAIDLVTTTDATDDDDGEVTGDRAVLDETAIVGLEDDEDDDDDEVDAGVAEDRVRHIARHAGELLAARASAGLLDPRVAEHLRPVLAIPAKQWLSRMQASDDDDDDDDDDVN